MTSRSIPLNRSESHTVDETGVSFRVVTDGPSVAVRCGILENGIVRYQLSPHDGPQHLLLDGALQPASDLRVEEADGVVRLHGGGLVVVVELDPWRLSIYREGGSRPLVAELPVDRDAHDHVISNPSGYLQSDEELVAARVNLAFDPHERIFGLGEKFTTLDKRGQRITCWNVNPYGAGGERAYKNIPFLVSSRGYGLFLNETTRSVWDVGHSSNFSLSIEVESPSVDLFVLCGPSVKDALKQYTLLTGSAPLPPRWSFGLWVSPFGEQRVSPTGMNQDELLALADTIRERQLPTDVIHLDPYWMGGAGLCHFQWDRSLYPDPAELIRKLRERGFRLCLWEHPYLEKGGDIYNEAAEQGYLLKRADGSVYDINLVYVSPHRKKEYTESFYAPGGIVDFTNPDAVEWYKSKHRPLLEMGVAAFKSDFGEMIPEDAVFFSGENGVKVHNLYPLLYNRAVYEVTGEYTPRPVVWGRSGYAGSQRYPVQWSGDPLSDLKSLGPTIRSGLNYGLSGIPFWTFDLGGFKGQPTRTAYVRWTQVGLFLSHSRLHGTTPRLPWYFDDEVVEIVRKFVRVRYRLIPYVYAVAHEATQTGVPVMRALSLEFPHDAGSAGQDLEFMLGPSMLVAAVLNDEGEATVYLPPGNWYDYWTDSRLMGPAQLTFECALESLPVYVKADAILPFSTDDETVSDLWDPLGLDIYPEAKGTVTVPEEEGAPTVFTVDRSGPAVRIAGNGPEREWVLVLHDVDPPKGVELEGQRECSWKYDEERRQITITVLRCGVFDLSVS